MFQAKTPVAVHNVTVEEEIADNEEVIFELNECLTAKENVLKDLETQAQKVEIDLKRYTTPYNCETGTLDEDISMFRTVASKYVKPELIDFYVDRMKKSASNSLEDEPSTISALCQLISDEQDV